MERSLSPAEQRTWDMQIACTCASPAFCARYHGLPYVAAELMALLPGVAAHQRERDRLYRAYDENPTTDNYSRLTAPFNSYRRD
jgi:hypothetical protein